MPASTAALSAICGTHFGLTKLVTSISRTPAGGSRCTSSILTAASTVCFSFCSPSRGPTSTRVTREGSMASPCVRTLPLERRLDVAAAHAPHQPGDEAPEHPDDNDRDDDDGRQDDE